MRWPRRIYIRFDIVYAGLRAISNRWRRRAMLKAILAKIIGWIGHLTWKEVVEFIVALVLRYAKKDWYLVYNACKEAMGKHDLDGEGKRRWVFEQVAPILKAKGYFTSQIYTFIELSVQALKWLED